MGTLTTALRKKKTVKFLMNTSITSTVYRLLSDR